MPSVRSRLRDDIHLELVHADETPFGGGLTGLCDALLRRTCAPLLRRSWCTDPRWASDVAPRLLERCWEPSGIGQLYETSRTLRDDVVHPDPRKIFPVELLVSIPERDKPHAFELRASLRRGLAHWVGAWTKPSRPPRDPHARSLWDWLGRIGAMTHEPLPCAPRRDGTTFIGHATLAMTKGEDQILVDPFFLPHRSHPGGYRQLYPSELRPAAVFITHSHPDHYHFGSLLRLGHETPIFVPEVGRESLLSVDMRARLEDLGFSHVETFARGDTRRVGGIEIQSLPFYGEQPSDREVLHPEIRNEGNTYVVDDGRWRTAIIADAGRDARGSVEDLAAELGRYAPVDVVAGGYRAWRIHPVRYLTSSVARYLLFVPRDQWSRRLCIMNDADALVRTASAWGARYILPYANGGAPWYWEAGLGPRLSGTERSSDPDLDPDLEPLAGALAQHSSWSRPDVMALLPGHHVSTLSPEPRASFETTPSWPYPDPRPSFPTRRLPISEVGR